MLRRLVRISLFRVEMSAGRYWAVDVDGLVRSGKDRGRLHFRLHGQRGFRMTRGM